jgi:hypothetical protein
MPEFFANGLSGIHQMNGELGDGANGLADRHPAQTALMPEKRWMLPSPKHTAGFPCS